MRYGMIINLKRCVGCHACTVACKQKNGTPPEVFWTKIKTEEVGQYPKAYRTYKPTICMHCADAPCVTVCPTGASYKREDGIVMIDQSKCIRCLMCISACPYQARSFDAEDKNYFPEKGLTVYEEQVGRKNSSVTKCYFCLDRLLDGEEPACVQTCPTSARIFGDLEDSSMQSKITSGGGYQDKPEEGTNPSVYYLP